MINNDPTIPVIFRGIYIDATTEELERALPFTKGKWKPYNAPLFSREEIEKGGIIDLTKVDLTKHKFEFATPKK